MKHEIRFPLWKQTELKRLIFDDIWLYRWNPIKQNLKAKSFQSKCVAVCGVEEFVLCEESRCCDKDKLLVTQMYC